MKAGLAATEGWQVATKVPPPGDKDTVKNACYQSCIDMGVDCIDLYYLHRIDPKVPIEVSMEAMNELIAEGKILYVGLSEASAATIRRAHAVCPLTCVQMEWSLYARDLEAEIVPTCAELGIGIVAYSPVGRGMLADTSLDASAMGGMDFRKMGEVGYVTVQGERDMARSLEELATEKGVPLSTLSLAWVHKKGRDALKGAGCVPIPGTSNPAHMEENVQAVPLSYSLTDADMAAIEACVPKTAFEGVQRYGGNFAKGLFTVEKNISMDDWKSVARKPKKGCC
jgi:aryl-alcohol dehydrogenase-like predicted oxidoreductase